MGISAKQVKALRDATGAGMMDCKKALGECDGDLEEAKIWLQKKGIADSKKRAGRSATEGIVRVESDDAERQAVMVELNCETDFVARNDEFQSLARELATAALAAQAPSAAALLEMTVDGAQVGKKVLQASGTIGEKLVLRRLDWIRVPDGMAGRVSSYIHAGGKVGATLAATVASEADLDVEAFRDLLRDLAMHVTASDPQVVSTDRIDPKTLARQKDIFSAQAAESGKPPEIAEKIVTGRLNKWKKEIALLDQPYVKDPDVTVAKHLARVAAEHLSGPVTLSGFVRYRVGEGIE